MGMVGGDGLCREEGKSGGGRCGPVREGVGPGEVREAWQGRGGGEWSGEGVRLGSKDRAGECKDAATRQRQIKEARWH